MFLSVAVCQRAFDILEVPHLRQVRKEELILYTRPFKELGELELSPQFFGISFNFSMALCTMDQFL